MNSPRVQTAATNKKTKQTNNALENALKRSNTTTTLEATAAAVAVTTSTTGAGASSTSVAIAGEEAIAIAINNTKPNKIEKTLKNDLILTTSTQILPQKLQQQHIQQKQLNNKLNIETSNTTSGITTSLSSAKIVTTKGMFEQSVKKDIGNNKELTSLPANITIMDENNKKIYTFTTTAPPTAGAAGAPSIVGGSGASSGSGGAPINVSDLKPQKNEELILVHNVSGKTSVEDPISKTSNKEPISEEYVVYSSRSLNFDGEDFCINPSQLSSASAPSTTTTKKVETLELGNSTPQQILKNKVNETTSNTPTTCASTSNTTIIQPNEQQNCSDAVTRNISAEEVQLVMLPSAVKEANKQNLIGGITKLENIQLKAKTINQQPHQQQTQQQQQQSTTTMVVTTNDLRGKAVTYSRIGNIQTTSSSPYTAATILNRVNVQSALKNQPLIVTTKRVSEVNQQTAKVSIGNTTISVPLLKPLNSHLIQTSSSGGLTAATVGNSGELTKVNAQPITLNTSGSGQQTHLNIGKIVNIKRAQKNSQPHIVSLSQLQIKPVSKIVQAKVVGKKMPIQLSTTAMGLVTSSTSVNTNAGIVTISAAKPKPPTHLHNLSFQKASTQMSIIPDSSPPQTLLEGETNNAESSEPVEVSIQLPTSKASSNNENLQMLLLNKGPINTQSHPVVAHGEKVSLSLESGSNVLKNVLAVAASNKSSTPPSLAPLSKHMEIKTSTVQIKGNVSSSSVSIMKQNCPRFITTSAGEATIVSTSLADASNLQNKSVDSLKSSTTAVINIPRNISLTLAKSGLSKQALTAINNQSALDSSGEQSSGSSLEFLTKKLNSGGSATVNITNETLSSGHRSSPQPLESPMKPTVISMSLKQNENSNSSTSSIPGMAHSEQKTTQISLNSTQIKRSKSTDEVERQQTLTNTSSVSNSAGGSTITYILNTKRHSIDMFSNNQTITINQQPIASSQVQQQHQQATLITPGNLPEGIIINKITELNTSKENLKMENSVILTSVTTQSTATSAPSSVTATPNATPPPPPAGPPKTEESYNVLLKKLLQNNSSVNTSQNSNQVVTSSVTSSSVSTIPSSSSSSTSSLLSSIAANNTLCSTSSLALTTSTSSSSATSAICNQLLSNRKVISVRAPSLGLVSSLEAQLARPVLPPVPTVTPTTQTPLMSNDPSIVTSSSNLKTSLQSSSFSQDLMKKQSNKTTSLQNETIAFSTHTSSTSNTLSTTISGGSIVQISNQHSTQQMQQTQHLSTNKTKPTVQIISKETSFISFPSQNSGQNTSAAPSVTITSTSNNICAGSLVSLAADSSKDLVNAVTNPREVPPQELFAPQPQLQTAPPQQTVTVSNSITSSTVCSTSLQINKTISITKPKDKDGLITQTPIQSQQSSALSTGQAQQPPPPPPPYKLPRMTSVKEQGRKTPIEQPSDDSNSSNSKMGGNSVNNSSNSSTLNPIKSPIPSPVSKADNKCTIKPFFSLPSSTILRADTPTSLANLNLIASNPPSQLPNEIFQTDNNDSNQFLPNEFKAIKTPTSSDMKFSLQPAIAGEKPTTPQSSRPPTPQQPQPQQPQQQITQKTQVQQASPSQNLSSSSGVTTKSQPPPPPYSSAIVSSTFTSSSLASISNTNSTPIPTATPTTPSTSASIASVLASSNTTPTSVKGSPETPQKADNEIRKKRKREYQKIRRQGINSTKEQGQQQSSSTVAKGTTSPSANPTTPTSKKRARKVSKFEEDYDSFIDNLMTHIRMMQPLEIMEPELPPNLYMSSIYGAQAGLKFLGVKEGDTSLINNFLVGDFADALPPNYVNIYETSEALKASRNCKKENSSNHNEFYDQEFQPITYRKKEDKIMKLIGAIRERNLDTMELIYPKNVSSQKENIVEESKKWSLDLAYPGLYFTNNTNSQCFGRMSPVAPLLKPLSYRKRNCYVFKPLKELDLDKCKKEIKIEEMDYELSDSIKKELNTESLVLALHPSVANSIIDVLKDLANILQVSPSIAYKIIESPNDDLKDFKDFKTEQDSEDALNTLFNIQRLLTGQIRLCRNCGRKRGTIQVPVDRSKKQYLKTNGEIDLSKPIGPYIYFCNQECQEQYQSCSLEDTQNNFEGRENILMKVEENPESRIEAKRKLVDTKENNGVGIGVGEPPVKRKRYKYFSSSNQPIGPALFKRPSEKEVTDLLFQMDITLSAYMSEFKDARQCVFCHQFGDGLADGPSRLLNFDVDKWVHLNCALWSNGVYETISGGLMNFQAALQAGWNQVCTACQEVGATVKCFKIRCGAVYHLPCAIKESCTFYKNKTIHCQPHASRLEKENELPSLAVHRRVFVERDENRQVATVMHYSDSSNLLRVGSLTFLNVGQLLPHQLEAFHTVNYIYPIGYKVVRLYWSMRRLNKRCRYVCSIGESLGRPEFRIQVQEPLEEDIEFRGSTPKAVWQQVLESIASLRKEIDGVQLFPSHINGEDLFGLTEPAIVRIIESLPGVETLVDYRFKYGRNPLLELPLAINPSGAARTEPKQRQLLSYRKPHTQRTAGISAQRFANTTIVTTVVAGEMSCPYSKQFVHSKSSQYKKMKQEWRNNVYLARSKIQGLGLYAARDLEKHTMIIEYIGEVIRTEVSEIREKQYEARNRGIYMFRLDEDRVVDATLSGGLARYINHSCNPNCVTEIVEVDREYRIIIFAKRRIHRGEELSYDYKFDIEDDANKISCMCGAPNCRKWMN